MAAALDHVLERLEAAVRGVPERVRGGGYSPPPGSRLDNLCRALGLSEFERDVLLMAVGLELDSRLHAVCEPAGGATFGLALAAFEGAEWSALAPGAPLRWWRLIEVGAGPALTRAPLRADDVLVGHLLGVEQRDPRLEAVLATAPDAPLSPTQERVCVAAATAWTAERGLVLHLVGEIAGAGPAMARAVCRARDVPLSLVLAGGATPTDGDPNGVLRLCERQARLDGGAILVLEGEEPSDAAARALERVAAPLIVVGPVRRRASLRPTMTIETAKPTRSEQRERWRLAGVPNREADRLAGQFDLEWAQIDRAAASAAAHGLGESGAPESEALDATPWAAARRLVRPRLDDLAQRVPVRASWADIVLPQAQMRSLHLLAAQVEARTKVLELWGFAERSGRGLGSTALFTGSSGTGKTTAAEVIAAELSLDLYRVDLSATVSKYIGETEKNLKRLFDAAEEGGAVLLFDEADALFSKRVETRDSHDRNANLEVSYLLQRLETFRGLAILTSNMRQSIDTAFARRFSMVVTFPFPDEVQRAEIWRRVFPAAAETQGLEPARMAQLTLSGGQIRMVALNAALLAARDERPVAMADVLAAAQMEYAKQDKIPTQLELRGWPT